MTVSVTRSGVVAPDAVRITTTATTSPGLCAFSASVYVYRSVIFAPPNSTTTSPALSAAAVGRAARRDAAQPQSAPRVGAHVGDAAEIRARAGRRVARHALRRRGRAWNVSRVGRSADAARDGEREVDDPRLPGSVDLVDVVGGRVVVGVHVGEEVQHRDILQIEGRVVRRPDSVA